MVKIRCVYVYSVLGITGSNPERVKDLNYGEFKESELVKYGGLVIVFCPKSASQLVSLRTP